MQAPNGQFPSGINREYSDRYSELMTPTTDSKVEAELLRLKSMPILQLRTLWRAKFNSEPPKAFGPDLLRRSIAHKVQEDAYGGLDRETSRLLQRLVAQYIKDFGCPRHVRNPFNSAARSAIADADATAPHRTSRMSCRWAGSTA